jgi:hypothetical protein
LLSRLGRRGGDCSRAATARERCFPQRFYIFFKVPQSYALGRNGHEVA